MKDHEQREIGEMQKVKGEMLREESNGSQREGKTKTERKDWSTKATVKGKQWKANNC